MISNKYLYIYIYDGKKKNKNCGVLKERKIVIFRRNCAFSERGWVGSNIKSYSKFLPIKLSRKRN